MTDLNKLRSEFEAQHSDKVFKIVKFDEATNAYCLHAHLPLTEINLSALAEINYGWGLWQKAKAQAAPEWISVKDELPSYEESVFIKTNKGSVQGYLFQDEEYSEMKGEYMKLDCWQDEFHDDFIEYSDVTHWMPLPTVASESGAEG
ncbi:DUF551 domain-containing protein [Acinetobacter baumannii]|uniref:DUF551 domain-containing protein n=1 Tax=Acinetobacter baumannii TaxID=470 RepID=UPI000C6FF8B9|nr:DUF551 domain-containing protein [Acinetobacter baumannii]MBR9724577.1 DUF551 domain-containing protein [Acinetobacter baumannii]PQL67465.1 DUF551 domain-containing protein [Acinetobacter baumannii]PQL80230.1 DUF551 domain-containing protein [Acinetobacter baumannii]HAV6189372.1 DUF551 domain-containing protein [Acinetobacter baumannii]HBI1370440.1 DUF551 domain-containing protein [Acinetobacter baumannii]